MTNRRFASLIVRLDGFSLTELLVALALIGLLVALLLPAVQAAREAGRNTHCKNHLRQLGLALAGHEAARGYFPSGGWGFQWVGDPDRGSGRQQPGGWLFSLLPYLEAGAVHDLGRKVPPAEKPAALGQMLQTPVPVLVCPSRRKPALAPFLGQYPLRNAIKPTMAFKSDYAGCGGDQQLTNGFGPENDSREALARYAWPSPEQATGLFFAGSQVRLADVTDGLSQTYAAGEKYVRWRPAATPEERDFGDDQAAWMGDDRDVRRWTAKPPQRDQRDANAWDVFGSRHPSTWNALFADASVRSLAYTLDAEVHRAQGNRMDGGGR